MLAERPVIVEGFAMQVLPSEQLSMESLRTGLQVWVERCFPDLTLPSITVERWTHPRGLLQDHLEMLLEQTALLRQVAGLVQMDAPTELVPDPGIAQPPYEDAA